MVSNNRYVAARPAWFVGAAWGGIDQTDRFLRDGLWENGYQNDMYSDLIDAMEAGDRIVIKSYFNQKDRPGLPFDGRGQNVTGMVIKVTGVISEHLPRMDGRRRVKVDWTRVIPGRDWYFSTSLHTVWKVTPGEWKADALIAFAFDKHEQDIARFRNDPQFRDRFGDRGNSGAEQRAVPVPEPAQELDDAYTVDDIIAEGCFLERDRLEVILRRLRDKKNLILQGPPGTGKTWLAKRLAFALIGRREERLVRHLQFHPTLSYEDFVRGWRPGGEAGLSLVDGPFLQVIEDAKREPDRVYVVVVEEINRGTPAQIFGEMLTLLEGDKRNPENGLSLSYPKSPDERVYVPPNLHLIGTMNIADRSLALVDLALRRRFAFIDLEPTFGDRWREWVGELSGMSDRFLRDIERRMNAMNDVITEDPSLGPQFRVGHSVVVPQESGMIEDPVEWFRQVVATEIGPLLNEYWFDDRDKAGAQRTALLLGLDE